jgi:microcystin-dependent protein
MSDQFVAEIRPFPFNFAPKGWALCNGQLLTISQNTALFSLLGTYYGGNGTTTFGLPNLQGAVPMHTTQYSGSSPFGSFVLGQTGGEDSVTLLTSEMPAHTHGLEVYVGRGINASTPENAVVIATGQGNFVYASTGQAVNMDPNMSAVAGGSQPHNNVMPTLVINYCIALQGIYPPRS